MEDVFHPLKNDLCMGKLKNMLSILSSNVLKNNFMKNIQFTALKTHFDNFHNLLNCCLTSSYSALNLFAF